MIDKVGNYGYHFSRLTQSFALDGQVQGSVSFLKQVTNLLLSLSVSVC